MSKMRSEIPPEITAFKEKFFLGLTVRQLICAAGMLVLAVPTGIFGSKFLPSDVVQYAVVLEVIPFAAMGWFHINDMPFEKFLKKAISYYFGIQKREISYLPNIIDVNYKLREIAFSEDILNKKTSKKNKKRM